MLDVPSGTKKTFERFYPRGVKDELAYYSTQFNCVELNATFYRLFLLQPSTSGIRRYQSARFFPKLERSISHFQRLKDVKEVVEHNIANMSHLHEKLEMVFLQMHNNFGPRDFDRVVKFVRTLDI